MDGACFSCPRRCGARRESGELGYCRAPSEPVVARAALHHGEEPCISGTRGSGAVFFCGCALGCVFCQNAEISRGKKGKKISAARLAEIFLELEAQGAHNINLVTPSHYTDAIIEALKAAKPNIPVVWNSSGYESIDELLRLEGLVQIYMPDYKYALSDIAARYSGAPDYPSVALAAIGEMYRQRGPVRLNRDGLLESGVLIRHLVLPGGVENSLKAIDEIASRFGGTALFSLMAQYTPMPGLERFPELCRPLTEEEYGAVTAHLEQSAIAAGFFQELESSDMDFIPAFDLTGV